jgi:hypothetical protein
MPKYGNYCCPNCGFIARDVEVPFGTTFPDAAGYCPACEVSAGPNRYVHRLEWLPQIGRMSAGNGPTFTAFETTGPDGKLTRINSISELRAMERESEKMAKDGVGQQMVWRDYANDPSNKYDHAINKAWEPDDYPGIPGPEQRAAFRQLTPQEGEARLEEARANATAAASPTE